ncbi:MAG: glycosyltransferase [Elusimicrobia bacterium]|nr:glycosyltransferase [Elusimicrobiota bacterium]
MDIFHVDGQAGLRGGERQLLYLACALRERGHRNVVAAQKRSDLARRAKELDLETLELDFAFEFDPLPALALRRAASGAKRPVLHAHTAHAASFAVLAQSFGGPPAVLHRRVDFPVKSGFSRALKYGRAARVVAVSSAIKDILVRGGLQAEKIAVVPDAVPATAEEAAWAKVPPERFLPSAAPPERKALRRALADEYKLDPETFWIGNLAALVPHKDHDTLVAAAFLVLAERPDARFLIGGEGPLEVHLWDQVRRMGLAGKVFLLGQVSDAAGFLKAMDAFALSSWGEGMGSVLLEAAACGAPIAATTAGGIPEIVQDGTTGLLCPPRDPEALAKNILRLMKDEELRKDLSAAARRRLPEFGLAAMAARTEKVYEELHG